MYMGIIMVVLGCIGLGLGHVMFGDIGFVASFTGIVSIVTGIFFFKIDNEVEHVVEILAFASWSWFRVDYPVYVGIFFF